MQNNPKVFIPQCTYRASQSKNCNSKIVPAVNLKPAEMFGEIVEILPSEASFYRTSQIAIDLKKALSDFNHERGDCLLFMGAPVIVAIAAAIIGRNNSTFNVLQWDRQLKRYFKYEISI